MIRSTREKTAGNAVKGIYGKGFRADLIKRRRALLTALDAATRVVGSLFPPGNQLDVLSGDRKGQWSRRINDPCRICFVWTELEPAEVEIVDYN